MDWSLYDGNDGLKWVKKSFFHIYKADIYLLKVKIGNSRTMCEICSKLNKTPERRQWLRSGAFSVNFEHISPLLWSFHYWFWTSK